MDRAMLTAALIVRNEERALPGCLDSLAGVVDALAIVDTGSTDGTLGLVEREAAAGRFARVARERRAFRGFGDARRRSFELADSDWILWIDADERLGPELRDELRRRRDDGSLADHDVWSLRFATIVLGRRMTCRELDGQRHLRLFRSGRAAIDAACVHESLVAAPDASVGELSGEVLHDTMTSWRAYSRKVGLYAALEARDGSRLRAVWHLPFALPATFWRIWVRRGCWRDGCPGFRWALMSGLGSVQRDWRRLTR